MKTKGTMEFGAPILAGILLILFAALALSGLIALPIIAIFF